MSHKVNTIKHDNLTINFYQDEDAESPREWDNLGTMVCFHKRYALGDKHKMSQKEAQELAKGEDIISLPLYLYGHGGISMSVQDFGCEWDSGCVGIIYVSKEKVLKEYGKKRLTDKLLKQVISVLKSEVEVYSQYLAGEIYGYVIETESGEHLDSCWGFIGMEHCEYDAIEAAKYLSRSDFEGKQFADSYGIATL